MGAAEQFPYVDLSTKANTGTTVQGAPTNAIRLTGRDDGLLYGTVDGQRFMPVAPPPLDWFTQRQLRAIAALNYASVQVDQPERFDPTLVPAILYGASAPTVDPAKSGTVYLFGAGGNGQIIDGPVPGASIVANPQAEAWYVARKISYGATTIASANVIPIILQATSTTAPPFGNNYIELTINAGLNTTHHYLAFDNGSGSPFLLDLGAQCALGSALCPIGAPFTVALRFDQLAGTLAVEFQDVVVALLVASGGQLAQLPAVPLTLGAMSAGSAASSLRSYGAFAMIKGPST